MFSSDYPFGDPVEHSRFLAQAPISPADRDKIGYPNAQKVFRLLICAVCLLSRERENQFAGVLAAEQREQGVREVADVAGDDVLV
jgi:hypothetical protein